MHFEYRPEVLAQLLMHGVRPVASTRPALVFRYVSDLYRFELRRLRARRASGTIPAKEYAGRVVALRGQYPLVSVPVQQWTVPGTAAEPDEIPLC